METVYKVVREEHGLLKSAIIKDDELVITYPVGQWVFPQVGRVLAFRFLSDAQDFFRIQKLGRSPFSLKLGRSPFSLQIWQAETDRYIYLPRIVYLPEADVVRWFWGTAPFDARLTGEAPAGTIACRKIKLIEQIKTEA